MEVLSVPTKSSLGNLLRATTILPINDLKGVKCSTYAEGEQQLRCKLAALYRVVDLCGWTHGIYNHISVRVDTSDQPQFLLNPFGLMYHEITASSLVKVNLNGDIVDQGTSMFGVNKAGFTLHSAIHEARSDIKCVIHLHTPAATAVSAMKCGLLPLSQESMLLGNISYHEYHGIFVDEKEKEILAKNLGPTNKIIILHNHGVAVCGETIEEAFHLTFNFMAACEAQVRSTSVGLKNIVLPSNDAQAQAYNVGNKGAVSIDSSGFGWKCGELEFEAIMRAMDSVGYRTGYDYKLLPIARQEK
ncbi:alpha-adducin [Biomphalaria glabrata]|uniref:Class II aldolase/adducin N-terminal domain-containing protein n=1 Tax=Biomphalaria glabrata TaxID=6526 RepID=A0A2C9JCD7_BIOGL|nr:alpha-adducin-like [Biomphalaria glabrata]